MPTVLRLGSLRVVIYFDDHLPAHIHIIGQGHRAVFILNCPGGPLSLRENSGFTLFQIQRIRKQLNQHVNKLCKTWEAIHG